MLTLTEPIKLNTGVPITTVSDGLSERIRGNYSLMSAEVTPKELLLLTASQDAPLIEEGNVTNVTLNAGGKHISSMTLEILNQVVNRILLYERPDFTYQDTVYVTTVLQKLGITDAREFMKQVRLLREENVSVHALLKTYQNHSALLSAVFQRLGAMEKGGRPTQAGAEDMGERSRYFLHNEIYSRLSTARIYRILHEYQQNWNAFYGSTLRQSEMQTAEQFRVSNEISVWQEKKNVLPGTRIFLQNHENRYETGDGMEPPRTEQQVLTQGAAAALLSLTDNVMISRMELLMNRSDFWLDVRTAVSQAAENSLFRFQTYHTGDTYAARGGDVSSSWISTLYRQESETLNRFVQEFSRMGGNRYLTAVSSAENRPGGLKLEFHTMEEQVEEGDTLQNSETVLQQAAAAREQLTLLTQQMLRGDGPLPPASALGPGPGGEPGSGEGALKKSAVPELEILHLYDHYAQSLRELTRSQTEVVLAQQEGSPEDPPVPEEAGLIRALEQINVHNREIHEQVLMQQAQQTVQAASRTPDREKIVRDSLRALENPEEVLREILEEKPNAEQDKPVPSSLETVLAHTDETTRRIFEAVVQYQRNPEKAVKSGIVRPSGAGQFNAEIGEVQEREIRQTERVMRERDEQEEIVRNMVENVTRQVQEVTLPEGEAVRVPNEGRRPPVPMVYHTTESQVSEEILEELERRRKTVNNLETVVSEPETREMIHQAEVNRVNQQTAARTSEDISELVNRTLSHQLGVITEKVYGQMEKRLRSERARRGWM